MIKVLYNVSHISTVTVRDIKTATHSSVSVAGAPQLTTPVKQEIKKRRKSGLFPVAEAIRTSQVPLPPRICSFLFSCPHLLLIHVVDLGDFGIPGSKPSYRDGCRDESSHGGDGAARGCRQEPDC